MNEVAQFISDNPDMGPVFREFATQYSSLAEVWDNCLHSDWMLWILYKRKYRNSEKLERYNEWLREQLQQHRSEQIVKLRLADFDAAKGWSAEHITEDLKANRITPAEARFRRWISAWHLARYGSGLLLNERVSDARWNKISEELEYALAGKNLHVPDVDEVTIRTTALREQSDKLRELIGNPFAPEKAEDFYYGRGQIG